MISFFIFIMAISSFLFYGVVGEDKTWLLGPAFILNYALITAALFKKALRAGSSVVGGVGDPASSYRDGDTSSVRTRPSQSVVGSTLRTSVGLPASGWLWIIFVIYGIGLISNATVPFEAKLVMLFIGGVVGAYIVWGGELTTFKDNRVVLGGLIFVVTLAALYGLIIHFKCPDRVLWAKRFAVYEGRLMSTYICPNHFAHLMQMLLPFCLVLLFIPQSGIYLRILAGYSFLAFLPPLYLTESRAGWLGSMVAIGVTVCLLALRRSKKLFALLVILVPLCSFLLLLAGWQYSETFQRRMQPVVTFLGGQAEEGVGSESPDFRPQTWMDTIDMIKEKPLIGFGPGNYRYTFPEHRKRFKGQSIVTGHPHNEYLELMADYGLIGFGLFSIAWIYGLVHILRFSLKTPNQHHAFMAMAFFGAAAGTMVHSFFDFEMHVYPNALVFALLAALACGPMEAQRIRRRSKSLKDKSQSLGNPGEAQGTAEEKTAVQSKGRAVSLSHPEGRSTSNVRKILFASLGITYMAGTIFCVQIMSSSFIRALGDKASEVRNVGKAEQYFQFAAKVDPQNWRAYKGMGELYFGQRYYSLDMTEKRQLASVERDWYEKAYQHNSHDPEIIMGLGKAMIFIGKTEFANTMPPSRRQISGEEAASTTQSNNPQIERGLALLREACNYRKFNDVYWWMLGVELRKAGHYAEALEVFQYAETLKRNPLTKKNIQWLEAQLRDGGPATEDGRQISEDGRQNTDLRLKAEKTDLSELLDLMGK